MTQCIDGTHPPDRAWRVQKRQEQGRGPGIAVFTKHPQTLHDRLAVTAESSQAVLNLLRSVGTVVNDIKRVNRQVVHLKTLLQHHGVQILGVMWRITHDRIL